MMLNRNAEALFWIGRYMERAENHARLIDVQYHIQEDKSMGKVDRWVRMIDALGERASYLKTFEAFSEKEVLSYITLEKANPNSLLSCVSHARSGIRSLREKLPVELWDIVNTFYLWLKDKQVDDIIADSPHLFFRKVKEWTGLFQGCEHSVMLRENEWHFLESGRHLERAENTVRILQSICRTDNQEGGVGYGVLLAVLNSVSGLQAFRRNYADSVSIESVIDFMALQDSFPRSVLFALSSFERHLKGIVTDEKAVYLPQGKAIRLTAKIKAELSYLEGEDIRAARDEQFLHDLLGSCHQLGLIVSASFFRGEEEASA